MDLKEVIQADTVARSQSLVKNELTPGLKRVTISEDVIVES